MEHHEYTAEATALLMSLIATPSVSRDEDRAATLLERKMDEYGLHPQRTGNNVWAVGAGFDSQKPTLLLNAHIDTVRPVASWTRDPFRPTLEGDRLYGLGSNDCGGGLVSLLQAFRVITSRRQAYNTVFLASAEEEVSGAGGIVRALPLIPAPSVAIVGEPTGMQPAVAEKGLMVLDITAHGTAGHAARREGVNAIYKMADDIDRLRRLRFDRTSEFLGDTVVSVTCINAGTQHNVIPDKCTAVADVRTNEHYTNEEVYKIICSCVDSEVKARSFRLSSSHIDTGHPLVRRCVEMGMTPFGSPTLSDQALMPFPSFKLGPGDSSRSHSADEYIYIGEIDVAIKTYIELLDGGEIKS